MRGVVRAGVRLARRLPGGEQALGRVFRKRHLAERRTEVGNLLRVGEVAVLRPCVGMDRIKGGGEVVRDIVQDFLTTYRTMDAGHVDRGGLAPAGAVLLDHPLALLAIPGTHEEYLERVGPKTRNMIRKARKTGYEFREFAWNDHLDDIHDVNTSKAIRQGQRMRGWYAEPVSPREEGADEPRLKRYYGAFGDGKLCAYLHLVLCGDFGFFRHFLGHAEHLRDGIMNGLISWTVQRYAGSSQVRWLQYGPLTTQPSSMNAFKRHAGFQPFATFLDLEDRHELAEYVRNVQAKSRWTSHLRWQLRGN